MSAPIPPLTSLLHLEVPGYLPSAGNERGSWKKRYFGRSKKQRETIALYLKTLPFAQMEGLLAILHGGQQLQVTLCRQSPRQLDPGDNIASAFKSVRDELANAFNVNDRDPRVIYLYEQRKGPELYTVEVHLGPGGVLSGLSTLAVPREILRKLPADVVLPPMSSSRPLSSLEKKKAQRVRPTRFKARLKPAVYR